MWWVKTSQGWLGEIITSRGGNKRKLLLEEYLYEVSEVLVSSLWRFFSCRELSLLNQRRFPELDSRYWRV